MIEANSQRRFMCAALAAGGAVAAMPAWAKLNFAKSVFSWNSIFDGLTESQRDLLSNPTREIQILYSQIHRDATGRIKLEHHAFHFE